MDAVYGSHTRWSISWRMPFRAMGTVTADRMRHGRRFYTTSRPRVFDGVNTSMNARLVSGELSRATRLSFLVSIRVEKYRTAKAEMYWLCTTALVT
jgi:hypothetical protein